MGYKLFYFYRLIRKRNVKSFKERLWYWQKEFKEKRISAKDITQKIRGWIEYARYGDSYQLRKKLLNDIVLGRSC